MSGTESIIRTDRLTVRYGGQTAVDQVSFCVDRGAVYAMLGRNGAGKSSLLRCLLGVQHPAAGTATLFGRNSWSARSALMQRVAVVPEEPDAPPEMTTAQILQFCSRVYRQWNRKNAADRLESFGIPLKQTFGRLSKGQKRQVLLATALAGGPELIVLDDPTLGLDAVARKDLFENLIEELAARGITVLMTTHDLGGIEGIATRVGVMLDGRLALDEDLETLKRRFRRLRFPEAAMPSAEPELAKLQAVGVRRGVGGFEAIVANYDDLALERFRAGGRIRDVEVSSMSLEEIFIAMAQSPKGTSQ